MKKILLTCLCMAALTASAQNPFAYGISAILPEGNQFVEGYAEALPISYTLNAAATKVVINFYKDGATTPVKTVELTAAEALTAGTHTADVAVSDLKNGAYTWSITATGAAITSPVEMDKYIQFWSPYGIAIDNNPESAHFGRVLCGESQASAPSTYFSQQHGGIGLFEFDPQLNFVARYDGGLSMANFKYPKGAQLAAFHVKKVRISKDGRVFVGMLDCVNNPIYELDPNDLSKWTPIFNGTLAADTTGIVTNAEGKTVAIASAAFDIVGSGKDLKIVNLSSKYGMSYSYENYSCNEYALGTATSWSDPISASTMVMPLDGQYTISGQSVSLAYDQDGNGIWYAQYRGTPSDEQPALKHVSRGADGNWTEDYSDIKTVVRGGGIAYNTDYSLLAIPKGNNKLGIYKVAAGTSSTAQQAAALANPTLTELYTITTTKLRGFNDIAFDCANNLYACDNGKETLVEVQLPRDNNDCEVAARSAFNFKVTLSTGVDDLTAAKTVSSVRYYNVSGQESAEPFQGVNIVVTNYTDGSHTTTKIVK